MNTPTLTAYLTVTYDEHTTLGAIDEARAAITAQGMVVEDTPAGLIGAFTVSDDDLMKAREALLDSVAECQSVIETLGGSLTVSEPTYNMPEVAVTRYGKLKLRGTAVYVGDMPAAKWLRSVLTELASHGDTHAHIAVSTFRNEVPTLGADDDD